MIFLKGQHLSKKGIDPPGFIKAMTSFYAEEKTKRTKWQAMCWGEIFAKGSSNTGTVTQSVSRDKYSVTRRQTTKLKQAKDLNRQPSEGNLWVRNWHFQGCCKSYATSRRCYTPGAIARAALWQSWILVKICNKLDSCSLLWRIQNGSATLEVLAVSYATEDNLRKWYGVYAWYQSKNLKVSIHKNKTKQQQQKKQNTTIAKNKERNQTKQNKTKIYHTTVYGSYTIIAKTQKQVRCPSVCDQTECGTSG